MLLDLVRQSLEQDEVDHHQYVVDSLPEALQELETAIDIAPDTARYRTELAGNLSPGIYEYRTLFDQLPDPFGVRNGRTQRGNDLGEALHDGEPYRSCGVRHVMRSGHAAGNEQ